MHLLEDDSALELRREKLDEFEELLPASRVVRFAYAEQLAKDKDAFRETLLLWLSIWRDVMLQSAGESESVANIDRGPLIEKLADKLSLSAAKKQLSAVENGMQDFRDLLVSVAAIKSEWE